MEKRLLNYKIRIKELLLNINAQYEPSMKNLDLFINFLYGGCFEELMKEIEKESEEMGKEKYCKCKGGLILANLETGKGECPLCNLPKKLNSRLKGMSKIYQDKTPLQKEREG